MNDNINSIETYLRDQRGNEIGLRLTGSEELIRDIIGGALLGAALGGLVGASGGNPLAGAIIGALIGGSAGASKNGAKALLEGYLQNNPQLSANNHNTLRIPLPTSYP